MQLSRSAPSCSRNTERGLCPVPSTATSHVLFSQPNSSPIRKGHSLSLVPIVSTGRRAQPVCPNSIAYRYPSIVVSGDDTPTPPEPLHHNTPSSSDPEPTDPNPTNPKTIKGSVSSAIIIPRGENSPSRRRSPDSSASPPDGSLPEGRSSSRVRRLAAIDDPQPKPSSSGSASTHTSRRGRKPASKATDGGQSPSTGGSQSLAATQSDQSPGDSQPEESEQSVSKATNSQWRGGGGGRDPLEELVSALLIRTPGQGAEVRSKHLNI
eukprot:318940-Prorocentrum_minimum.AAC.3